MRNKGYLQIMVYGIADAITLGEKASVFLGAEQSHIAEFWLRVSGRAS